MKKISGLVITVLLFSLISIPSVFAGSTVNINIGGQNVQYNDDMGHPFIDANGRTQVPFKVTLEAIGAKVGWDNDNRMAFATYNGTTIYTPIGESYIIINGEKITNDTTALIKDGRTYCPISKVLTSLGFNVSWNGNTRTVLVTKADSKLTAIPHPTSKYFTATPATGKYSGYQVLHGYPEEDEFIIYFNTSKDGNITSSEMFYDLVNPPNMNEKISWQYNGVTLINTRQDLYDLFSTLIGYDEEYLCKTYGQVYLDWFYGKSFNYMANEYVEAYLDNVPIPDEISFEIIDSDWMTFNEIESTYNLMLFLRGKDCPYLQWMDWESGSYSYSLPGFYQFDNGFLEFNNIRMISTESKIQLYVPDVEAYIISTINESVEKAHAFDEAWLTLDELVEDYGIGFYEAISNDNPKSGFYVINSGLMRNDGIIFELEDYDKDFTGEKVFSGIRMQHDESGGVLINREDFNNIVISYLYEYEDKRNAFNEVWISSDNLSQLGINFVDIADTDTPGYPTEYVLTGNFESVWLRGLYSYDINTDSEQTFNGIEVKIENHMIYFKREDLYEKGLVE